MRIEKCVLVAGALIAGLAGCSGSSGDGGPPPPRFSGAVGTTWEPVADGQSGCPGFSDYSPSGQPSVYALEGTSAFRFDPVAAGSGSWTALASPPDDLGCWPGPAWVRGSLFMMRNDQVFEYAIADDSWTTPVTSGVGNTTEAQMAHDDAGRVYGVESDEPYRVVRYDPASGTVTKLLTGGFGGYVSEPRLAWDPLTRRLYVGPGYDSPELWAFDPEHPGTAVRRADVPAVGGGSGTGMGDPFCGDRSGHLYAAGDTGCSGANSVFQYDTRTDTWKAIPDLPEDHGCNGACTVSHDGWLYFTPGDSVSMYRLRLQ